MGERIKFKLLFVFSMNVVLYAFSWCVFILVNWIASLFGEAVITLNGAYFIAINCYLFMETYKAERGAELQLLRNRLKKGEGNSNAN